jgi:AcrR family transcriptional regulator
MSTTKRGRGRPRREGADEEILSVARTLLAERGYRELTVDAVAERAGVAKTTVYRRWPSKGALISALIPPAGSYANANAVLRDVQTLLAPLADADDAEVLGVVRAVLRSRRDALIEIVGEARADELLGAVWMKLFVV